MTSENVTEGLQLTGEGGLLQQLTKRLLALEGEQRDDQAARVQGDVARQQSGGILGARGGGSR
ncbi:hypothetical protein [Streptomyces sp. NPDC056663]|uniref:hypothetical protein n=1 Tax=Streptomyces sp. NPDC056663 TaxID=3345899 RepID=UPI0036753673